MLLDVSKIEGYESMSAEDKVKALEAFEYEDNAAELEKLKNAVSKSNADAKSWKDKYNAKLSDEDKQKEALEEAKQQEAQKFKELEDKYNELMKSSTLKEHTLSLNGLGFDDKLAADTAAAIVDGDAAKLFKNMKTFLEGFRKSVEKELMDKNPGVNGNGGQNKEEADKAVEFAKGLLGSKKETGTGYSDVMKQYSRSR